MGILVGGPAVGDIRSRCLRLSDQSTSEALAVHKLIGHRLPLDAQAAKLEWYAKNIFTAILPFYLVLCAVTLFSSINYINNERRTIQALNYRIFLPQVLVLFWFTLIIYYI